MDKEKRHNRHRLPALAATVALLVAAIAAVWTCGTPRPMPLHRFYDLNGTWHADSVLRFTPDSIAESGQYVLTLTIRRQTAHHYPYRECYIEKAIVTPDDTLRDTLRIDFDTPTANGADGRTPAASRGTAILQTDADIDTLRLEPGWQGTVCLRHLMRHYDLPGLTAIGLTMTRR